MKIIRNLVFSLLLVSVMSVLPNKLIFKINAISYPVQPTPNINLSISPNPVTANQSVTFTVSITGSLQTPTGTVNFLDNGGSFGAQPLDGYGRATFTTNTLSGGNHTITVQYNGDTIYASNNSSSITLVINAAPVSSNINISNSPNPSTSGQSVTFNAKVTGGSGLPTGSVTFNDGSTNLGTSNIDNNGQTNFSVTTLSVGQHTISAIYNGDSKYTTSSSNSIVQTVNAPLTSSSITLTANSTSGRPGDSITFSAIVTGGSVTATGKTIFNDGSNVLSTVNLDNAGQANYISNSLSVGSHNITATYIGNSIYTASTSNTLAITINASLLDSNVTLTSDNTVIAIGQNINLTVKVSKGGETQSSSSASSVVINQVGIPTGMVTFKSGSINLGTQSLDNNGTAVFGFKNLNKGINTIIAQYSGDDKYNGSQSTPITINVNDNSTQNGSSPTGLIAVIVGLMVSLITAVIIFGRQWYLKRNKKYNVINDYYDKEAHDDIVESTENTNDKALVETHLPEEKESVFDQLDEKSESTTKIVDLPDNK